MELPERNYASNVQGHGYFHFRDSRGNRYSVDIQDIYGCELVEQTSAVSYIKDRELRIRFRRATIAQNVKKESNMEASSGAMANAVVVDEIDGLQDRLELIEERLREIEAQLTFTTSTVLENVNDELKKEIEDLKKYCGFFDWQKLILEGVNKKQNG